MTKKVLLWVGDAGVSTGFARITHHVLEAFREEWDVKVLGINYLGDPHRYPYDIYPCYPGGDAFGVNRVKELCAKLEPALVVLQNDPWNIDEYMQRIPEKIPVIATLAVDGKNCMYADKLNKLRGAIFWTSFGQEQARRGGFVGHSTVIPLGVDLNVYRAVPRAEARKALGLDNLLESFIVGNVNRNQPRKRLDLTVRYFCEWVKSRGIKDAVLYLHVAPTGDQGYDVKQLMHYYGLHKRLVLCVPEIGRGTREKWMSSIYSSFDVQVSTTQGEGWGLTTLEGMACGVPQIVPDWSALGEWPGDSVTKVTCTTTSVTPNYINVVGGIADEEEFIEDLHRHYTQPEHRERMAFRATNKASEVRFNWGVIASQYRDFAEEVLGG